jgi:hypothetical protein
MARSKKQRAATAKATAAAAVARTRAAAAAYRRAYRLIAGLRAKGQSFGAIAAALNARGVPTRNGRPWYAALVFTVLRRGEGGGQ